MSETPPDAPTPILGLPLAATVGELIAAWGSTHWLYAFIMVELVTGKCIKPDDENTFDPLTAAVVIGMQSRVQIGLLKTLSRKRIPRLDAEKVAKLLDAVEGVKDARDTIAHGFWEFDGQAMYVHMLKTVGRVKQSRDLISPETVAAHVIRLHKCNSAIVEIFKKHGFLKFMSLHGGRYF